MDVPPPLKQSVKGQRFHRSLKTGQGERAVLAAQMRDQLAKEREAASGQPPYPRSSSPRIPSQARTIRAIWSLASLNAEPPSALERVAAQMVHAAPWAYERLLRRPQEEGPRSATTGRDQERGRAFGVSRSSVKRYAKLAQQGRPLAPKRRPGSKPKTGQTARSLLETDPEERPVATLSERREFPKKAAGVSVSESTVSRMLKRFGWSRKKIAGGGGARRVPEGPLGPDGDARTVFPTGPPRLGA